MQQPKETQTTVSAVAFDYATLASETAEQARNAADTIRSRHRRTIEMMIATGADLLRIKGMLDHGQFGKWLKAEFDWTERTARNYMQAAEAFQDKTEIVSELPPTLIYKLSAPSTPTELRERVVAELEAGSQIDPRKVADDIHDATKPTMAELEAELKRKSIRRRRQLTPEDEKRIERERRKAEAAAEQRRREIDAAVDEIAEILNRKLTRAEAERMLELLDWSYVLGALLRRHSNGNLLEDAQ